MISNPKTQGSKMVNIRKAFHVLSKRPEIDARLLNREFDIQEGRGITVRALLRNMKKAYRNVNKTFSASRLAIPNSPISTTIRSQISGTRLSATKRSVEEANSSYANEPHVVNPQEYYAEPAPTEKKRMLIPTKRTSDYAIYQSLS